MRAKPTARPSILMLLLLALGSLPGCKRYQRIGECRDVISTVNLGLERLERMTAGETLPPLPPPPLPPPTATATATAAPSATNKPNAKPKAAQKPNAHAEPQANSSSKHGAAKPTTTKAKSHQPRKKPTRPSTAYSDSPKFKPKPTSNKSKTKRVTPKVARKKFLPITTIYGPPEPPYEATPEMLSATERQEKKYQALAEELTTFSLRVVRAPLTNKHLTDWSKNFGKVLTADVNNSRRYARELRQHMTALKSGDKKKVERSETRLKRTRDAVKRRSGEYKRFRANLSDYCHSVR